MDASNGQGWWTGFRARMHEEGGVALITALLITMVLASIAVSIVGLSFHDNQASGLDRSRLEAVDAAEGGLNVTLSSIAHTPTASLPCGPGSVVQSLSSSPPVEFRVKVQYYATFPPSGSPMDCPLTVTSRPAGAVLTSKGIAGKGSQLEAKRSMQTQVKMTPIFGSFGQAIFSDLGLSLSNNLTVSGDQGNDGNLYTNGNWVCDNNSLINGSVYVQGSTSMSNSCSVAQDLLVNGAVTMTQSAHVGHDVASSTAGVNMSNSSTVTHNATAATTCTGCTGRVAGAITASHVSPQPPYFPFPTIEYDAFAWQAAGFDIGHIYSDCNAAKTFIGDVGSATKTVVRITPACALAWGQNTTINVRQDLAIITDGSIATANQTTFRSADGSPHVVYLIIPTSAGDAGCTGGVHDLAVANNTNFTNVKVFVYSPCTVSFNNNNNGLGGQIFGGTVFITNQFALQFEPLFIAGAGVVTGYNSDVAFLREVTNSND